MTIGMKLMILILKKFDINSVINKNAYILFYEKVDIDNEDENDKNNKGDNVNDENKINNDKNENNEEKINLNDRNTKAKKNKKFKEEEELLNNEKIFGIKTFGQIEDL